MTHEGARNTKVLCQLALLFMVLLQLCIPGERTEPVGQTLPFLCPTHTLASDACSLSDEVLSSALALPGSDTEGKNDCVDEKLDENPAEGKATQYPAWYAYVITISTVFNGFAGIFFPFAADRSRKCIHGILYSDFQSDCEKKITHIYLRVICYVLIFCIVFCAAHQFSLAVMILSLISCILTVCFIILMYPFRQIEENLYFAKFSRNRITPDLKQNAWSWQTLLTDGLDHLGEVYGKTSSSFSKEDVVFYLKCCYQGWRTRIEISRNGRQDEYDQIKLDIILLNFDWAWSFFCKFQQVQHRLLKNMFHASDDPISQVRLLLDSVRAMRKEVEAELKNENERAQEQFIDGLLFDLTAFLTYTNLLFFLIHQEMEDLLLPMADGLLTEPVIKEADAGKQIMDAVEHCFLWLNAYTIFLFLEQKREKIAHIEDAAEKEAEQKSFEELMIMLQLRFDLEKMIPLIDFTKKMHFFSAQRPKNLLSRSKFYLFLHSEKEQNDEMEDEEGPDKPLSYGTSWYDFCIRYNKRMRDINEMNVF